MQDINQKIEELISKYQGIYLEYQKNKHDYSAIKIVRFLLNITSDVIESIEELYREYSGEEKKKAVCSIIKQIYKKIDPDIPGIPGIIESYIENIILDTLVPAAIDYIVGQFNRLSLFKHKGE